MLKTLAVVGDDCHSCAVLQFEWLESNKCKRNSRIMELCSQPREVLYLKLISVQVMPCLISYTRQCQCCVVYIIVQQSYCLQPQLEVTNCDSTSHL